MKTLPWITTGVIGVATVGLGLTVASLMSSGVADEPSAKPAVRSALTNKTRVDNPYYNPDKPGESLPASKAEWKKILTTTQYNVAREEATEPAFRNKYWNNKKPGTYHCLCCGNPLFSSETKFESGTGWPSFYQPLEEKSVGTKTDNYLIYSRTEVHCAVCEAHLGHVFTDGPRPTGLRYCMNSAAMNFEEATPEAAKPVETRATRQTTK